MVRIDYRAAGNLAELTADAPSADWDLVRRVCEERSDSVTNESATRLVLPWWTFLACRAALAHTAREFNIPVELTPRAEGLLQKARAREESYRAALNSPPADEADIVEELQAKGFSRELKSYQKRNVARLATLPSAATFSVPGAGKTTEALAFFFLNRTNDTRLLVIAPKNAHAAWEEQLELCIPNSPLRFVRLRHGAANVRRQLDDRPDLMLITYELLPSVTDIVSSYLASVPSFVFLDESHRMKGGHGGVRGRAVLGLSHLPERKLILSGTPLPNTILDLVPQFDFLYPEIRATGENVADLIRPVYVRTTKPELRLDPPRVVQVNVSMRPGQRHLYELLRSEEARDLVALSTAERLQLRRAGRSVMRLLQLTSNPALLLASDIGHTALLREVISEGESPKIEYVCRRARQLASERKKVVIWTGFVENVELIANRLADLGAVYIHGGVEAGSEQDEESREARIQRFHDGSNACMVLVANPAACSEGISLHTVCHNALYVDRNYNAAQFLQSQDRIHRIGLPEGTETTIEVVACPDSIDDSIERRLQEKTSRMGRVLNDPSLVIEPEIVDPDDEGLSAQDVEDFVRHLRGE